MMMASTNYPGSNEDDLKRLDALAVQGITFEQAWNDFEEGSRTPKDIAEKAFNDFARFYGLTPGEGRKPVE